MEQLIRERLAEKVRRGASTSTIALDRLRTENEISKDFIHEVGVKRRGVDRPKMTFDANGKVFANIWNPDPNGVGGYRYDLHKHAISQLAVKLGIPGQYLTSLATNKEEWARKLASEIMNEHIGWTERNRVLVRAVGDEIRGVLSDHYKRLNSAKIIKSHVDSIYNNDGRVSNGFMDDTRIYIESFLPEPIKVITENNGDIFLAFGTRLSTSDYGDGALELRSFVLQGVCLNGLVRESVLRKVHLGSRLPDNLMLSDRTYRLDTETYASAVKDLTDNLYTTEAIKNRLLEVKAATEQEVSIEQELANLVKGRLLKGEAEEIGKVLMRNDPNEGVQGKSTLWKLTQGITNYANKETVPSRRKMELQEIAGDLFGRL